MNCNVRIIIDFNKKGSLLGFVYDGDYKYDWNLIY